MKSLLAIPLFFLHALCIPLLAQTVPAPAEPPLTPSNFSVWSQRMDMSAYAGKKYRLTAAIRKVPGDPEAFACAFIRNETPQGGLRAWVYMDNMMDRPVRDSTWKTYTLEYTVDEKANWIGFGVLAFGEGVFYYDDMRLSVETEPGKWSDFAFQNSGFEHETLAPWQQTAQGVPVRVLGATATPDSRHPFEGKQCLRIENHFLRK